MPAVGYSVPPVRFVSVSATPRTRPVEPYPTSGKESVSVLIPIEGGAVTIPTAPPSETVPLTSNPLSKS